MIFENAGLTDWIPVRGVGHDNGFPAVFENSGRQDELVFEADLLRDVFKDQDRELERPPDFSREDTDPVNNSVHPGNPLFLLESGDIAFQRGGERAIKLGVDGPVGLSLDLVQGFLDFFKVDLVGVEDLELFPVDQDQILRGVVELDPLEKGEGALEDGTVAVFRLAGVFFLQKGFQLVAGENGIVHRGSCPFV